MSEEIKEIFNIARNVGYGMDAQKDLLSLFAKDSNIIKRLREVAVEIDRGRTDKEFHYLLKTDPHYSTTRRLRHQFWNVYNQTVSTSKAKIPMAAVHAGIVSRVAFDKIMECEIRATYILTQPQDVRSIQKDLLYEGYRWLDDVMGMEVLDHNGRPDHKMIQTKINIIKMMEDRISGSVVQREHKIVEGSKPPMESKENLDRLKAEVEKLKKDMGKTIDSADFKEVK